LAGIYRKTHLFGDERRVFARDHLLLVRLAETLVVPLVCFDLELSSLAGSSVWELSSS
jgi:hypothetical protein